MTYTYIMSYIMCIPSTITCTINIYYVIVLLTVAGYDDTRRRQYISINHYLHNKCLLSFSQAIIEDCYISTVSLSTSKHSMHIHRNVIKVGWNKFVITLIKHIVCPSSGEIHIPIAEASLDTMTVI